MCNYSKITNEDRKRVIEAYLKKESVKKIAEILCLKISTVYSIINTYKNENRIEKKAKGGVKNQKINEEINLKIIQWVEENCALSLKQIKQKVFQVFNILVCETTIRNSLLRFHYSLKKISIRPQRRNNEQTINIRENYANNFLVLAASREERQIIFLDEVGFCFTMRSGYGRSIRGTPAVLTVPQIRSRNISVCCSISKYEILYYRAQVVPFNTNFFTNFLIDLFQVLIEKNIHNALLIMDNVGFHKAEIIQNLVRERGHEILYLPPYSPFLNPIENMFAKWKQYIRSRAPQSENELINLIVNGGNSITMDECKAYYRNMHNYVRRSIRREIIED